MQLNFNTNTNQILPFSAVSKSDFRFENEDSLVVRDAQINTAILKGYANSLGNKITIIPKKGITYIDIPLTIVMPRFSTLKNKIKLDKLFVTVLVHYDNCEGNYLNYSTQFDNKTGKFGLLKFVEQ